MSAPDEAIAIYLPSLTGGGAERVMVTLANGFAAQGHAVDLVLATAEGPYLADVVSGVRVVDLASGRVFRSLPRLIRYLRRECPTAMLSALSHANVVAIIAHWLSRVPTRLVVSERNTLSVDMVASPKGRLILRLMRLTYPRAAKVTAVSKGVAQDLEHLVGLPPEKIEVIYNPVVTPELLLRAEEPLDHPWLRQGEPPVILGVGRLTAQKDFATLLRAFALLRAQHPARLVILGEGEQRRELEALVRALGIAENVLLPGFVENPFAWMHRARVFVLSSRYEGLPGVLIQAMACGARVVSTDCPSGPAEILEDGRFGRLVPVGDTRALADAITATTTDCNAPDTALRALAFGIHSAVDMYRLTLLGRQRCS